MSDYEIRNTVYAKFRKWGFDMEGQSAMISPYNDTANHLCWLLGRDRRYTTDDPMTSEETAICEALAGPHGYAYYKMMLIRKK